MRLELNLKKNKSNVRNVSHLTVNGFQFWMEKMQLALYFVETTVYCTEDNDFLHLEILWLILKLLPILKTTVLLLLGSHWKIRPSNYCQPFPFIFTFTFFFVFSPKSRWSFFLISSYSKNCNKKFENIQGMLFECKRGNIANITIVPARFKNFLTGKCERSFILDPSFMDIIVKSGF